VHRERWILTPHPGEASRLLRRAAAEIQADRYAAVVDLADRFDSTAVLKGACTLVATGARSGGVIEPPDRDGAAIRVGVCDRGNTGMASAGTGDVLSGVLGALVVQTRDLAQAARVGVLLHALAGDAAAEHGQRGTLASDLMPHIRRWANPA
jgi:NAD(P)H-hydrate epimerase